jgi:hypothetical protein
MGNRIFVAVVIMLWATTMSWLLVAKILPPFFSGEPPTHGMIEHDEPVCWEIGCGDHWVGYAVRQAVPGAQSTTEVISRVVLKNIPLRQMAPQWMGSIVEGLGAIQLDSRTRFVLDSFGNLSCFDSKVQLNDLPLVVRVYGSIDGSDLRLRFISGDVSHEVRYPMPKSSTLDGELAPEPKLLQVYVGRSWQTESFSPIRPPNDAIELLRANVVAEESIMHEGEMARTRRIEYRSLSAAGVASDQTLRGEAWVAEDGTVLRHDVYLMNTKLRFERRRAPQMIALANDLLDRETVATLATPGPTSQ